MVDDSLVIRGFISRMIDGDPDFKVVSTAGNGQLAIEALQRTPADVVILDIEMPVMDGLTAIPKLKAVDPAVQIVMASTLTQRNAEISLRALSLGATDYLSKPSAQEMALPGEFQRILREKVRELGRLARRRRLSVPSSQTPSAAPSKIALRPLSSYKPDSLAIGASTGGPQALFEVIRVLGNALPMPVLITQHMPASFTPILAEHITRQCHVTCLEGQEGELLKPGRYYLAPGDFHMLAVRRPDGVALRLTKDAAENFCRPSVDPMLRSLIDSYGGRVLAVILTGMGQDGLKGCEALVKAGGAVIAQDEASSVVWGMPGTVATAGLCTAVAPLQEIGKIVRQMIGLGAR